MDPPEANAGETRIWDGSENFESVAQYICSDGLSLTYAVCYENGWNHTPCTAVSYTHLPSPRDS